MVTRVLEFVLTDNINPIAAKGLAQDYFSKSLFWRRAPGGAAQASFLGRVASRTQQVWHIKGPIWCWKDEAILFLSRAAKLTQITGLAVGFIGNITKPWGESKPTNITGWSHLGRVSSLLLAGKPSDVVNLGKLLQLLCNLSGIMVSKGNHHATTDCVPFWYSHLMTMSQVWFSALLATLWVCVSSPSTCWQYQPNYIPSTC